MTDPDTKPRPTFKCCETCSGDDRCEHTKVCVCGELIEDHHVGSGHMAVSMHDYYNRKVEIDARH